MNSFTKKPLVSFLLLVGIVLGTLTLNSCGSDKKAEGEETDKNENSLVKIGPPGKYRPYKDYSGKMVEVTTNDSEYSVVYQPGVKVIDGEMANCTYDLDKGEFIFEEPTPKLLRMDPGDLVLFSSTAARKVTGVKESGNKLILQTDPALLTEIIKDGRIRLDATTKWKPETNLQSQLMSVGHPIASPLLMLSSGTGRPSISVTKKWKLKGWDISFSMKAKSADTLEYTISASTTKKLNNQTIRQNELLEAFGMQEINLPRGNFSTSRLSDEDFQTARDHGMDNEVNVDISETQNVKGFLKAKGHISGFKHIVDIEITDGDLVKFHSNLEDLEGKVELRSVGLGGLSGLFSFNMPISLNIPYQVGPIPIWIKLGSKLSLRPQVRGGSSQMCWSVDYKANSGFTYEAANGWENKSDLVERKLETCGDVISAGGITLGLGGTVEFPKMSISMLGEPIVVSSYVSVDGHTLYEPGILSAKKACQSGGIEVAWIIDATLKFLGLEAKAENKLWYYKEKWPCPREVDDPPVIEELDPS